jgi:hypothetical protein
LGDDIRTSIKHTGAVLLLYGGLLKGLWMKKRAMTAKQGLLLGLIEALNYKDEYLNDTNVYSVIDECIVTDNLSRLLTCHRVYIMY